MEDQTKNLILATLLSIAVLVLWMFLSPILIGTPPVDETPTPAVTAEQGETGATAPAPAGGGAPELAAAPTVTRAEALGETQRVRIDTARLGGSLSLRGGRIDDLDLKDYRETIAKDSPDVTLLTPAGVAHAYYALYGWSPSGGLPASAVPGPATNWTVEGNDTLTETTPVTLSWDNGQGLVFRREMAIDKNYMFTITQTVENNTGAEVKLAPYGIIARHGMPADLLNFYILHEGVIGAADGQLTEIKYKNVMELPTDAAEGGAALEKIDVKDNGWIGFTDHYWMTTLIPPPGQPFTAVSKYTAATDTFQTDVRMPLVTVAPGQTASSTTSLFAGAKEWATIRDYQNDMHIDRFVDSIDWGWFFFLTKPIFWMLHHLHMLIGNMGLAIIGLTFFIKALLFPLAYKSYVSMSKMKALQPELEKIKEKAGDDRMKVQTEMMALYKREKVNPAAGCLPILLQVPIFFSLYKVIFVTLELRHAPFFGWIQDLSAPDPSSILNLFGLLPWATPAATSPLHIISIGVWPILLGISMWLQQKLNPAPADKTQAQIFAWMPWVFMFMLGRFASGLVIYWVANNTITFTQQYLIMRSQGIKPDVFGNMFGFRGKSKKAG
ncbi:membrane protein insertase YidC [Amaricoccus solimangrovi]|uniref:Membrane protein insertase YidC n=1 Tax=Amaricoccus solimangrovi TaxID=2589815 RepID=A0A501WX56_9RHOB|nr:membrane protein insertase YidC [Amaricoccus solimangrovi]TPE50456.1 membrane protein insertase YidC [Amaricoccus solimangrovi]